MKWELLILIQKDVEMREKMQALLVKIVIKFQIYTEKNELK